MFIHLLPSAWTMFIHLVPGAWTMFNHLLPGALHTVLVHLLSCDIHEMFIHLLSFYSPINLFLNSLQRIHKSVNIFFEDGCTRNARYSALCIAVQLPRFKFDQLLNLGTHVNKRHLNGDSL